MAVVKKIHVTTSELIKAAISLYALDVGVPEETVDPTKVSVFSVYQKQVMTVLKALNIEVVPTAGKTVIKPTETKNSVTGFVSEKTMQRWRRRLCDLLLQTKLNNSDKGLVRRFTRDGKPIGVEEVNKIMEGINNITPSHLYSLSYQELVRLSEIYSKRIEQQKREKLSESGSPGSKTV